MLVRKDFRRRHQTGLGVVIQSKSMVIKATIVFPEFPHHSCKSRFICRPVFRSSWISCKTPHLAFVSFSKGIAVRKTLYKQRRFIEHHSRTLFRGAACS